MNQTTSRKRRAHDSEVVRGINNAISGGSAGALVGAPLGGAPGAAVGAVLGALMNVGLGIQSHRNEEMRRNKSPRGR